MKSFLRPDEHYRYPWLLVAMLMALAGQVATIAWPPPGYLRLFAEAGVYNVAFVLALVLILIRGFATEAGRAGWLAIGIGVAMFTSANLYEALAIDYAAEPAYPSLADFGWLGSYAVIYLGVVLLVRSRVERFHTSLWLDGAISGLGIGGLVICLVLGPVLVATEGDFAAVATTIAYPAADLLLIILVVISVGLLGWRLTPTWALLGLGCVGLAITDVIFLRLDAVGEYEVGGWLDIGWPAAFATIGVAATVTDRPRPAPASPGPALLAIPIGFMAAGFAVLVYGQSNGLPSAGVWVLCACCGLAIVRLGFTFRELATLADTRRLSRTDDLTGLANRRHFYACLSGALRSRSPTDPLTVLVIDLDRFKEVNDSLGHGMGDALLESIGPRITDVLRPGDTLARLGGDEFAVLLPGSDPAAARAIALRLADEVSQPHVIAGVTLHIGASVGASSWPVDGQSPDELMARADVAMYVAKTQRVGVEFYDAGRDGGNLDRFGLIEALRAAIGSDQLVVHYQPKKQLSTGRVTGVEALVRWEDPSRGLIPPIQFVPLAEQSGLMGALTAFVLRESLRQLAEWHMAGEHLTVSVNVSAAGLREAGFADMVGDLLREHQLGGEALILELTEDTVMSDPVRCVEVMHELRALGVRISIDDYGTGHSSLSYLRELPIDELKLDRSFIMTLTDDLRLSAIVESTVALAHSLGLPIVAEGVETAEAEALLAEFDCDLVQGYFICRPVSGSALTQWLGIARPLADR